MPCGADCAVSKAARPWLGSWLPSAKSPTAVRRRGFPSARFFAWADRHRRFTGKWPNAYSGRVSETVDETWTGIHQALYVGLRGLPGGSTLAKLLTKERRKPPGNC